MNFISKITRMHLHFSFFGLLFLLSGLTNKTTSSTFLENHLLVVRNNSIIFDAFDVLEKEATIEDIVVFNQPDFGNLKVNSDYTLTFRPFNDICEETDNFTYVVRKKNGLDTVNVNVDIICEKLTFLSGFSPNGDGLNDTFTVIGAEAYPNNSLVIFNKWGEEVFASVNYKNSWDGTDKNGDSLTSEDNVYYYVFNDGEGNIFSGYIKIE
ncbi:MAG: gliding motility-associated-like protein [Saprospiraceae bacterium]|jgi:gliding motility-associated-like protein